MNTAITVLSLMQSHSRPMKEILSRVQNFDLLQIEVFPDDVIMSEPVENWPIVDCLISFFSRGFPLDKAIDYVKLRQPVLLNDMENQYILMDRFVFACRHVMRASASLALFLSLSLTGAKCLRF